MRRGAYQQPPYDKDNNQKKRNPKPGVVAAGLGCLERNRKGIKTKHYLLLEWVFVFQF
jgi:hypothetical protein